MSRRYARISHTVLLSALFMAMSMDISALSHVVQNTDTLFGLSLRYEVPQEWIQRANNLDDETIRTGQSLEIPLDGIQSLSVRQGDTLSSLALTFGLRSEDIRRANKLENDSLRIGQVLKIPPGSPDGQYRVLPGDTLSGISLRFDVSIKELKMFNNFDDDSLFPGQIIIVEGQRPEGHEVGTGESLWSIASAYNITMKNLRKWNSIENDVIHPGMILALYAGLDSEKISNIGKIEQGRNVSTALASVNERPETRLSPENNRVSLPRIGEYFYNAPDRTLQPNTRYWEEPVASSLTDYHRAGNILADLDAQIAEEAVLSDALRGWHVVLDPGHGGLDPGAIVSVNDGNGNPLVITEDEYAYDISLRVYRALKRHGASVSLTILAPDHHVRNGIDARQTFVHRKNEVYNDEAHNGNAAWRPVGTSDGLDLRKNIAADQISEAANLEKRKGTLFLSIHADNSPDLPSGRAVLFDGNNASEREASRDFAGIMATNLGAGSFMKEQSLRVLRDNPADAAVLIEARNINYKRNAWALRSDNLREQDALMIVDGILAWANR